MSERWNETDELHLQQLEAEMHGELTELREAATRYADRAWARGEHVLPSPALSRSRSRTGWLRWTAAGTTAALTAAVLTVGGSRLMHPAATPDAEGSAVAAPATPGRDAAAVSDEALLLQIQSDLSNGVPAAMRPLQVAERQGTERGVGQGASRGASQGGDAE